MDPTPPEWDPIEARMMQLFALVSEALAGATDALLGNDASKGSAVVEGDQSVDDLTAEVELLVWRQIDDDATPGTSLRHFVGISAHFARAGAQRRSGGAHRPAGGGQPRAPR